MDDIYREPLLEGLPARSRLVVAPSVSGSPVVIVFLESGRALWSFARISADELTDPRFEQWASRLHDRLRELRLRHLLALYVQFPLWWEGESVLDAPAPPDPREERVRALAAKLAGQVIGWWRWQYREALDLDVDPPSIDHRAVGNGFVFPVTTPRGAAEVVLSIDESLQGRAEVERVLFERLMGVSA